MSLVKKDNFKVLVIWNTSRFEKKWQHSVLGSIKWQFEPELNLQNTPWLNDVTLTNNTLKLPPLSFVLLVQKEHNP